MCKAYKLAYVLTENANVYFVAQADSIVTKRRIAVDSCPVNPNK